MTNITPERIAELRKLAGKATRLDWTLAAITLDEPKADYEYIFAAANAVPDLLDALEAERTRNDELANMLVPAFEKNKKLREALDSVIEFIDDIHGTTFVDCEVCAVVRKSVADFLKAASDG